MPGPFIVACVNLKGGVGKTAIAVNFAAYCGSIGMRTLLVDLDPQTNATFSCISVDQWEEHATKHGTVADLFGARAHANAEGKQKTFDEVVKKGVFKNLDLVPSHVELFTIDLDLAPATARESKIKKALTPVLGNYDMIVCDCPPEPDDSDPERACRLHSLRCADLPGLSFRARGGSASTTSEKVLR
jgi:chromosome partitioning protein